MKKIFISVAFVFITLNLFAYEKRDILQKEAAAINIAQTLVKNFSELKFPGYSDRNFWTNLPDTIIRQYITRASAYLDYDWPAVKATDYLEIIRSGDRRQGAYAAPFNALQSLVMGELAEGKGRFMDQIINAAWYFSEQTWWGWSAHLTAQKAKHGLPDADEPTIDLGVGEVANALSWTYFLFKDEFDKVHPLISKRLKDEIMKKAVLPYYNRDDFWWMGFGERGVNNWNPWTNHNLLTAILILEDDQERKVRNVNKVIRSLDQFINSYPDDGGCDEGPSYWGRAGASLYQSLDLLKRATSGKFNVYDQPIIRNIGNYFYKAHINYPYFINFADADATTKGRAAIVYNYGKNIQDPVMQKFGAFLAKKQDWGVSAPGEKIDEQILQLMNLKEIANAPSEAALVASFWLPQTQVAGARDKAGSTNGFFFAAKGGHNAESHNHNDLGSGVMYYNGEPVLIDLGRETYTAKTFSGKRYEIWTMQSQYHNAPKINGQDQKAGRQYQAKNSTFADNGKSAIFTTDIAGAYPEEAAVKTWVRQFRLDRGKQLRISDSYELNNVTGASTINVVTYCKVSQVAPGVLNMQGKDFSLKLHYDPKKLDPKIEFTEVTDSGLKRYWPNGVTRIVFNILNTTKKGTAEIALRKA